MELSPITPLGYSKLKDAIAKLRLEIDKIVNAMRHSGSYGDRSENGEYTADKQAKSIRENKLNKLLGVMSRSEVITPELVSDHNIIQFGAKVTLVEVKSNKKTIIQLVSAIEANPQKGLINISAPAAQSLICKTAGSIVIFKNRKHLIEKIRYSDK